MLRKFALFILLGTMLHLSSVYGNYYSRGWLVSGGNPLVEVEMCTGGIKVISCKGCGIEIQDAYDPNASRKTVTQGLTKFAEICDTKNACRKTAYTPGITGCREPINNPIQE